jgi:dihydropteroate synthase
LIAEGADLIDVGGESTRPYSTPIDAAEELRRVLPVVERICTQTHIPVSIDTSKASVARAAIDAGCQIINDVTGLEGDPEMIALAAETRAAVCAMHMQGTPQTMQNDPQYDDVVEDILVYLKSRRDALVEAGVEASRIALDPGVGFGKTHQHNVSLLAGCGRFHALGRPLLVGYSRKGFIGKILGDKQADRSTGGIGVALALASQGVQILRVHDVQATRQALLLHEATGGVDGMAATVE